MELSWLIVILFVVAVVVVGGYFRKKKVDAVAEKYVCDVCHGSDCECRRADE